MPYCFASVREEGGGGTLSYGELSVARNGRLSFHTFPNGFTFDQV